MPRLSVTTVGAEQVWASPDGQRKIRKVTLDYQGKHFEAKTYSDAISNVGWSGEVDTEERPGKMGPETFVKQPPKEGGFAGGGGGGRRDDSAIKAQWAIGQAVQVTINVSPTDSEAKLLAIIEARAKEFFAMVERVKTSETEASSQTVLGSIKEVMGDDVVLEDIPDEPLKLSDLPDM